MNVNEALGQIVSNLPYIPDHKEKHNLKICTDDNEILCASEQIANAAAHLIDALFNRKVSQVGYYDPEEDSRNDCVDDYTGWYYVSFN